MNIKKTCSLFAFGAIYLTIPTLNAKLEFINRDASITLKATDSRLKLSSINHVNGWQEESIILETDLNNSWLSNNIVYGNKTGDIYPHTHLLYNDSNAIVNLKNYSIENSNAIVNNAQNIINNSNAIINTSGTIINTLISQNSWAIISLANNAKETGPSRFIQPTEKIYIDSDQTLDGKGSILYFATHQRPVGPQFIIEQEKTLILKNICLAGLTSNTFDFRKNSTLIIGENVSWELHENITLTSGNIVLQNQIDENKTPIANLFYLRGIGGKKRFTLSPESPLVSTFPMLALRQNTIALQDIEFTGLGQTTNSISNDKRLIGAVGLAGGAAVNIDNSTNMAFAIMGLENTLRILENNLILNGQLDFVGLGEDVVHFDFVLRSPVESLNAATQLKDGKVPVINFETNFIYLTSFSGIARLIFDDSIARINNSANAFIATNNGFLGANKLLVSGDPIWDESNDVDKNRFSIEAQEIIAVKKVGDDYEKLLPEFGIPIIVDPLHPHRSLKTEKTLLKTLKETLRPKNALLIEMEKEKGI